MAEKRFLQGKVVFVDKRDNETPAVGVDVTIEQTGDSDKAKAGGWAMTQNNLDAALQEQGIRSAGEEGRALLAQAASAYEAVLDFEQRYTDVSARLESVYHDWLYRLGPAFALNQRRVALLPGDLSAQADFAEKHLTTARFAEAVSRSSLLIEDTSVPADTKIALRAIRLASLLGLGELNSAASEIQAITQVVAAAPEDFQVNWSFAGTKQFVRTNPVLAPYKDLLLQVLTALEAGNRATVLERLQAIEVAAMGPASRRER